MHGVSVNLRQVSKVVKGLRTVMHQNCRYPTGRIMSFITKSTYDINDCKNNMILTQHHEVICNKKRLYRRIRTPLMDNVTLQEGIIVTMQQDLQTIPSRDWGPTLQRGLMHENHRHSSFYLQLETS